MSGSVSFEAERKPLSTAAMRSRLASLGGSQIELAGARLFRAPGRVNLMGDHTDYNGGLVLPMAIDLETHLLAAASPGVHVVSLDVAGELLVAADGGPIDSSGAAASHPGWAPYVMGVLEELSLRGRPSAGFTGVISADIPLGRGLSSSAALEIVVAITALGLAGFDLPPMEIAAACRDAEAKAAGVECGIMDQTVVLMAEEGSALLLDCSTLLTERIPIPGAIEVWVVDSGVERALAASAYNERRHECDEALAALRQALPALGSLSELTAGELEAQAGLLDRIPLMRARHVVAENARVRETVGLFRSLAGDGASGGGASGGGNDEALARIREIFFESHRSLADDYEAGHPATDALVRLASSDERCVGGRQTGAGWGGSVVLLARAGTGRPMVAEVCSRYAEKTGLRPAALHCRPSAGASEIPAG